MSLPTSITAGAVGHLNDHEEIHQIVDDVFPSGGAAPADANLFRMMRYARQAATPSAGRLGSLFQDTDVPALAPGALGRLLLDDGTAYRALYLLLGDAIFDLRLDSANANISGFRNPSARVSRTTTQSIATGFGSYTALIWDVETGADAHDNDNLWAAGNPSRLTATRDGFYLVGAYVAWAAGTGQKSMRIQKNNAKVLARQDSENTNGEDHNTLTTYIELEVGDYVQAEVAHDGGANRTVQTDSAFWMAWQGDEA